MVDCVARDLFADQRDRITLARHDERQGAAQDLAATTATWRLTVFCA
jgi:hypothetical protein